MRFWLAVLMGFLASVVSASPKHVSWVPREARVLEQKLASAGIYANIRLCGVKATEGYSISENPSHIERLVQIYRTSNKPKFQQWARHLAYIYEGLHDVPEFDCLDCDASYMDERAQAWKLYQEAGDQVGAKRVARHIAKTLLRQHRQGIVADVENPDTGSYRTELEFGKGNHSILSDAKAWCQRAQMKVCK